MNKLNFFQPCDRWRVNNPQANLLWGKMIKSSEPISKKSFEKIVDIKDLLEEDETLSEFMSYDESYFRSSFDGITVAYAQTHGFEFIFTEDGKSPEELISINISKDQKITERSFD